MNAPPLLIPPPLRPLLAAYSAALHRALGGDLRGIYLYGSVALGAYLPGSSDVDVAVLHGQDLTTRQREALSSLHRVFSEAVLLDVSFVPLRLVGSDGEPSLACFRDGRFQASGADVNAVLWHTLRRRGITVWGPPAQTLVPPVSAAALVQEMRRNLGFLSRRMPHYLRSGTAAQVFGVLSLCRVLHTQRTGEIVSKLEAAQWALGEIDPAWRPLVERAVWRYRQGHFPQADAPGAPRAPQRRGEAGDALLAGGATAFAAYCVRASGGATEGGRGGGGAYVDATGRRTGGA